MTNTIEYFRQQFDGFQATKQDNLGQVRKNAFDTFSQLGGIPAAKNEEWKYTRISALFNKEYQFPATSTPEPVDIAPYRLPGNEVANELVFINGQFSFDQSVIRSANLVVLALEEAMTSEYRNIINQHLGHSSTYSKDGINALNMAFLQDGIFIAAGKNSIVEHPVYIYNITDARSNHIFAQPRSLVHVAEHAQLQIVETFATIGTQESFTNQVIEVVVEKDAVFEYYKIQNDITRASQVNTTHIRQVGKSTIYAVTISLDGGIIRNNTNVVLEADHCEAHLYGLNFQHGQSHVDNHTIVDNVKPHCYSNELYKGIVSDNATGIFNGKIYVRPQAQKTNAYQSNKNVLLSDTATINTKPQLEIFADDVKCSHGCTIGRLDEEGLFYLQSRGIPEKVAKSLLLQSFATDILEKIKLAPIRQWVEGLISERLELL